MFRKFVVRGAGWTRRHQTILAASVGSLIVATWTVLRHITNGINFDVVGQVGVAGQWLHGLHGGAELGSTNYLLKMPLYALINLISWIPPVARLLILALLCSVGAYLLIYILLRKIGSLYRVKDMTLLNLGMLWLATIAGRVFWVDYANSRNLETAGGLAVLYLVLVLLKRGASWRRALLLVVISAFVFFADPLQLYVIGGGAGIAMILMVIRYKPQRQTALFAGGALVAGAVLSRVLAWASTVLLPVSYLAPPKTSLGLSPDTLATLARNVLTSTLRLFDINIFTKAFSVNSFRQLGGLLLLGMAIYLLTRYRKSAAKLPVRFLYWLIFWNYAVYIASGNAQTAITERYLVMVPLFLIAALTLHADSLGPKLLQKLIPIWLVITMASGLLLFGAVFVQWPSRYALDQPMFALADFTKTHQYDFVVSSQVLAVPGNYYAGYDNTVVPLVCQGDRRVATKNLFYDQDAYRGKLGRSHGIVAVVLPEDGITSGPSHCSNDDILTQLGTPTRSLALPGVGTVYEYTGNNASLQNL